MNNLFGLLCCINLVMIGNCTSIADVVTEVTHATGFRQEDMLTQSVKKFVELKIQMELWNLS